MIDEDDAVDWDAALESVQGRRELLRELIDIFFQEYPELMSQIDRALEENEPQTLHVAAHRLKGCLRYFGKNRSGDLASQLEMLGRAGTVEGGRSLFRQLESALERWTSALRSRAEF